MSNLRCTVLSKMGQLLDTDVVSLHLPGVDGDFTILAHHTPLIALLRHGTIEIQLVGKSEAHKLEIERGTVETDSNHATILVDLAVPLT